MLLHTFGLRPWELGRMTGAELDVLFEYLAKMRGSDDG